MSLVCGTDFSEMAAHAATVAGCLACRTGQPLHLVHALDLLPEVVQAEPGHRATVSHLDSDGAESAGATSGSTGLPLL